MYVYSQSVSKAKDIDTRESNESIQMRQGIVLQYWENSHKANEIEKLIKSKENIEGIVDDQVVERLEHEIIKKKSELRTGRRTLYSKKKELHKYSESKSITKKLEFQPNSRLESARKTRKQDNRSRSKSNHPIKDSRLASARKERLKLRLGESESKQMLVNEKLESLVKELDHFRIRKRSLPRSIRSDRLRNSLLSVTK